jgi:hypothetical protein
LEEEVRRVAGESITNAGDSTRLKEFEMPLHVTETAAREIDTIIQQQGLDAGKICLRVGVKGGGCSGFSYILDLTEVQKDSDECWSYSYGRRAAKAGANEGAGSTITKDTPPGALTVARGKQTSIANWKRPQKK